MEEQKLPSPADVADAFVAQYFVILSKSPENLHKFYQEPSLLGWPGIDGVVLPVTTLKGINEKVMSSEYKNCSVEVKTTDAQESQDGGIIVAVTGCLIGKDDVKKNFSQTFFLAQQEKGFFVLNDILRVFDACTSVTAVAANSDDKDDQPALTQNSASGVTYDGLTPLNFKAAIQNGKVEEASDHSVLENNIANGASSTTPSIPLAEVSVPPKEISKQSVVAMPTTEKVPSVVKPATRMKVPSVLTPALSVPQKNSYAYVLANLSPTISPSTAASKQTVESPTTKSSSPCGDLSPKVSTPSGGILKASDSSSRVAPKSPSGGQHAPSSYSAYSEVKGIYIGGLPFDVTKQGIVDVVKQFGQVRRHSDTVQIRRHEDGFCCGFVEFESVDSARRAVEAHRVMFGDKEAYVMYKRIPHIQANSSRARSPMQGEQRNNNSTSTRRENGNGEWTYNSMGRVRGTHRSNSSDQRLRQAS